MPEFKEATQVQVRESLQFPEIIIRVSPLAPGQPNSEAQIQLEAIGRNYKWTSVDGVTWTHETGPVVKRVNVSTELLSAVPPAQRAAIYAALESLIYAQHAADEAAAAVVNNSNPLP